MDKKSKILLGFFGLLIVCSVAVTYWRIMIEKDYIIEAQIECDPALENCFVYECDPEFEECTGDPVLDTSYYKIIRKKAANIPLCDSNDENCQPMVCLNDETDCEIILCDEETKTEMDICNDPEQYAFDNLTEEEVECENGGVECLTVEGQVECIEGAENCEAAEVSNDNTEEASVSNNSSD